MPTHDIALSSFKNAFVDGTRQNLFMVDFSPLTLLFPTEVADLNNLKFLVTATSLPGRTHSTIKAYTQGLATNYSSNYENKPWTVTFINDVNYTARAFLEAWGNLQHNLSTNTKSLASTYKEGLNIYANQLDGKGKVIARAIIMSVFPSDVGDLGQAWESGDWQTYQVTFQNDGYELLIGANVDATRETISSLSPNSALS